MFVRRALSAILLLAAILHGAAASAQIEVTRRRFVISAAAASLGGAMVARNNRFATEAEQARVAALGLSLSYRLRLAIASRAQTLELRGIAPAPSADPAERVDVRRLIAAQRETARELRMPLARVEAAFDLVLTSDWETHLYLSTERRLVWLLGAETLESGLRIATVVLEHLEDRDKPLADAIRRLALKTWANAAEEVASRPPAPTPLPPAERDYRTTHGFDELVFGSHQVLRGADEPARLGFFEFDTLIPSRSELRPALPRNDETAWALIAARAAHLYSLDRLSSEGAAIATAHAIGVPLLQERWRLLPPPQIVWALANYDAEVWARAEIAAARAGGGRSLAEIWAASDFVRRTPRAAASPAEWTRNQSILRSVVAAMETIDPRQAALADFWLAGPIGLRALVRAPGEAEPSPAVVQAMSEEVGLLITTTIARMQQRPHRIAARLEYWLGRDVTETAPALADSIERGAFEPALRELGRVPAHIAIFRGIPAPVQCAAFGSAD